MDEEIVVLEGENGEKINCTCMGTFDFNGKTYGAFIQVMEDGTECDDVILLTCEPVGDGENLDLFPIEDDEELDAVYEEFLRICSEDDDEE